MYLLDTSILTALRRIEREPGVSRWVGSQRTTDIYLSVATVGEVERRIAQQMRTNPVFAYDLASWLDRVLRWYGRRVLSFDLGTARRWSKLSTALGQNGADLLIAATAIEHVLTVVTRNVRHFEQTGVPLLNPFE